MKIFRVDFTVKDGMFISKGYQYFVGPDEKTVLNTFKQSQEFDNDVEVEITISESNVALPISLINWTE